MKFAKIDNWGKYRHDGLLYFAQRINEMLDPENDYSHKAPILNTRLLVDEYLETAKSANGSETIKKEHLKFILEEFLTSFAEDIVVQNNIDKKKRKQILCKINGGSDEEKRRMMEYTQYLLCDYNLWCKNLLFETVSKREIKSIEQVIRLLVPGLTALGYSNEFIYQHSIDIFYKRPVNSIESLQVFINRFDSKLREYDVFIAIDSRAVHFQKILEKHLSIDFGPFSDDIEILYDKDKYVLTKIRTQAFDEYTAVKTAYDQANIFFTFYLFVIDQPENWCYNETIVVDSEKNRHIIPLKPLESNYPKKQDIEFAAFTSDLVVGVLKENASTSYSELNKMLCLHNTSLADSDIKNRFLNLWSILEIMFVQNNSQTKIQNIIDKALPILQKKYLDDLFYSISSAIYELNKQLDMSIIEEQILEEDRANWHLTIICEEKYSEQRNILYSFLADYPLLKYRISQLSELCKDRKNLLLKVNNHSRRVSWHIRRLYRARNNIIHSGVIPSNLHDLGEHLHVYVHLCLADIVLLLAGKRKLESFSNAHIAIQLRKEELISLLDNHSPFSTADLFKIT